jgi:hypothetical protein
MNGIAVLKDVAYATKRGGGLVTTLNDVGNVGAGALAIMNEKGVVINLANAVAEMADNKYFSIVSGRANDNKVVTLIPRVGLNINKANYRATVAAVTTIGGTTVGLALPFTDEGEASITVTDISYSGSSIPRRVRASAYKRVGMTNELFVDKLVTSLNRVDSFVVAAKVGGGTANMGITITAKDGKSVLDANCMDMFENASNVVTTAYVHGQGEGVDIAQMEKDASVEDGNSNYIDFTDEHYSVPTETVTSANYDVITLNWEGMHSSPSRSQKVMINNLSIACIQGAATLEGQNATDIMAILNLIVGNAYDTAEGAETADDDGTSVDGIAGN